MFRSLAVVALAILPGLAVAQQSGTHTVARGETLWEIAVQYYGDGYAWSRIYEANRGVISDPDRIAPGLSLTIPSETAAVTAVAVTPGPGAAPSPQAMPAAAPQEGPASRTVFYRTTGPAIAGVGFERSLFDVPRDQFYSAPWLIPVGTTPARIGVVEGFAGGEEVRGPSGNARPFQRLILAIEGPTPPVGSRLQTLRVARDIDEVGDVIVPSGILVVDEVAPGGVVAWVESQYARILVGDLARLLPQYTPLPVDAAQPATGATASIIDYATDHEMPIVGDHAFLDAGADDGVSIGDEYVVVWSDSPDLGRQVEGRVKVVAVQADGSTARIVDLKNPVFVPGVQVRLDRRVR